MTKLEQLLNSLTEYASKYRTKHSLGDETLKFPYLCNNTIISIHVGQSEPANIALDELWYNGQVLKHCTGTEPNTYKVVTTFFRETAVGYGYFTSSQIVPLGDDLGRTVISDAKIIGNEKLEPNSPSNSKNTYTLRINRTDGSSFDAKPTWSLSSGAPVTFRKVGNGIELTGQPIATDTMFQLNARYQDPEFGPITASKTILVVGTKEVKIETVEIIGPSEATSNATNVKYFLRVWYSDGTFKDDLVQAYWKISNLSAARFASGSREETGAHVFVNMLNHAYDMSFVLTARIVVNCSDIKTASKTITIKANSGMQGDNIYPYYGKGPAGMRTANFILGLSGRGEFARRQNTFELELCEGEHGYYAYPVSYGKATFINLDNNLPGGWESDPSNAAGDVFEPEIVSVPVDTGFMDFYIYQTDYAGLGVLRTEVK